MYEPIAGYEPPNDAPVWRYLDFTKFVSLLDGSDLFFSRADRLGDPFEGSFPLPNVAATELYRRLIPEDVAKSDPSSIEEIASRVRSIVRDMRSAVYVSCWHLNKHESAAMWKLYLKSDEGIAIRSSTRALQECFQKSPETIMMGNVKYIDYELDSIIDLGLLAPFVHKRHSFEHEQELRAIILNDSLLRQIQDADTKSKCLIEPPAGCRISINLSEVVEKIHVSPTSADWFHGLVKSIASKYGLSCPVIKSRLRADPIW